MKQLLTLAAVLVMTFTAYAQPLQGQGPRGREFPQEGPKFEQKDPAQIARTQTDQLDQLVSLTPKQYKRIYRFNRKQAKERQAEMESMRPEGFPGGRPPMGQVRPDGMGPGMNPGMSPDSRPPRDGQFRPGPGPRSEALNDLMESQKAKREKKYRKVLTPAQFQLWETFEAQRDFRRITEGE